MRLNSIKLAGFKSFVDPTQLAFQSNLTAIVGPNGCGKSNIVDAIYCVLGSTSKNLRAEQMADVIFNGTTARKPVGQAAIELVFDNSEGKIGGEYANYPEISIRRELNRDGQSNYYINGIRCRRRDITDIFLGTGLGNNSYAIIEQGMISRLIEAKPEELRAHVEEAAGTSKYKERRRETENRIKHTRENLDRLNDLREEQTKQLTHLQRQANAAEKYKLLKTEQRLIRTQLQAILWQSMNKEIIGYEQKINVAETNLEGSIAELRQLDKEIELKRSQRMEQSDAVQELQGNYYGLGAEISKIEQQIAHSRERKKQLENDYEQLETNYQELKQQHFEDENQFQELTAEIEDVKAAAETTKKRAQEYQEELKTAETKMHQWQEQWDDFNRLSAHASKQVEVEKTKVQHLEQKQQSLITRHDRIKEQQQLQMSDDQTSEVNLLQSQQQTCQEQLAALQEKLASVQENINLQKSRSQEAQLSLGHMTKELRDLQAQNASMQALQQIALGKNNSEMTTWLNNHNLHNHQRLAEGLDVEAGWEIAVETVLAHHLDAICIESIAELANAVKELNNAQATFFNLNAEKLVSSPNLDLIPLHTKVISHWPITNLLQDIYIVEQLSDALQFLEKLDNHQSIVTRDGIWLNRNWLRVTKTVGEKTGVLQREHDLKELQQKITKKQTLVAKEEASYQEAYEQLNAYLEEREAVQNQIQIASARNSELMAQIKAKQHYIQQLMQRHSALQVEMTEVEQQLLDVGQLLAETHMNLANYAQQAPDEDLKRQHFLHERDMLKEQLDEVRQQAGTSRQKADECQIRVQSMHNQVHYLSQNLQRVERQLSNVEERRNAIQKSLNTINDPIPELTIELQQTLEKRALVESDLSQAKQHLDELESNLQQDAKKRQRVEQQSQEIRNALEQVRLDSQSLKVKRSTYAEQIAAAGFVLEEILAALPEGADTVTWEENLGKIDNRIQRLGPINLAAIDEYATLLERKNYLDKQHDDLIEALTTLENAIRKIDRETRIRFKETFTQLNESFMSYFKEIFGGGDANLELTSDDLLETGVIVKAQPPGKRNTTIHLLSGGEKALTAIALVFAIFSLNPAPFCVLDEVDAPLDDANVGRYCNLVKKMSEKIQFIFISHNKIAIEMGQQLAGVTMNEPGVSRLVSVDVEQAISMATA